MPHPLRRLLSSYIQVSEIQYTVVDSDLPKQYIYLLLSPVAALKSSQTTEIACKAFHDWAAYVAGSKVTSYTLANGASVLFRRMRRNGAAAFSHFVCE